MSLQITKAQEQAGFASVRPLAHEGLKTESNVFFSHDSLFASHRTIPFGKIVRVTNLNNLQTVELKIIDRGPFIKNHIIDLSQKAAFYLGIKQDDITKVKIKILNNQTEIKRVDFALNDNTSQDNSISDDKTQQETENKVIPKTIEEVIPVEVKKDSIVEVRLNKNISETKIEKKDTQATSKLSVENLTELKNHQGDFTIEVGSFFNKEKATDYANSLRQKKVYNVNVVPIKDDNSTIYKVYVGKFTALEYAQAFKKQLLSKVKQATIVPVNR